MSTRWWRGGCARRCASWSWRRSDRSSGSGAGGRGAHRVAPVRPIIDPPAARLDELAGTDRRGMADDGDQVALAARLHPQNAEPAVLVVERHSFDKAGEVFAVGCGLYCLPHCWRRDQPRTPIGAIARQRGQSSTGLGRPADRSRDALRTRRSVALIPAMEPRQGDPRHRNATSERSPKLAWPIG